MAEAVVSIALETLRDLLLEEARFLSGVSSEVKALQTQLKEIQCLLKDADRRQHESESVVNWIAEIRDLAYRAEDAIETYAFHVFSKRRQGFKHLLRRFSCVLDQGISLHQIGSEISEIKSEIERVTKSMQEYGIIRSIIQRESSSSDNQQWKRQTFPFEINEDFFVGKEDDLKRLLSLIIDDEQQRVISIWGMGGIGKTTIARKVYNHNETKHSFDSFAWVCITQQCQIRSVLEDVLKQLIPQERDVDSSLSNTELIQHEKDDISGLSNTELMGKLCQIQKVKRCMIVLDDLWETDHWDSLKHAFLVQGSKSKILVTTRKQNVADNVGLAFELGLLSVDDGLELLKQKAIPHSSIPDFAFEEKWLQKIGEEMVCKCGRLPLAISLLSGILSKKKSMREWELVNENMSSYLYRGDDIEKKEIYGVLSLSYEDLPHYLKPCFFYMSLFKEDKIIDVDVLYRLWIAQGMISHENQGKEETLMDIAELYLSELASRCVVQVQVEDVIQGRRYRSCKLHDVVRELCLSKGKRDFGLQILSYQGGKIGTLLHESLSSIKTRHLAIHFEREIELEDSEFTIIHEDTTKHVRSLQFRSDMDGEKIEFPHTIVDLQKFKLVRNLVFEGIKFARRKIPRGIGNLIHLRYLCFRYCELDELPPSISNLVYLHTLDLLRSWNVRVPNVLNKMCRLKHLLLPRYDKEGVGSYRLILDEGLDELETLIEFNSWVHESKSITRMKNLRNFDARVQDNESLSEIINAINTNWKSLRYCTIRIERGCQFTTTDEGLMNLKEVLTCPNLHYLKINAQLGRLLEECGNEIITSKLVRLYLLDCSIENDPMEILGKLPLLEDLRLIGESYLGEEMKCHALSFPHLKKLVLGALPNLRKWRMEEGAMPIISEIIIYECPQLKMIPDGLRFTVTLQKLTISDMPKLGKRVSTEGGKDFDKVRHVPFVIIS